MVDQQTGVEYYPVEGTFTAEDGSTLRPGWSVTIGLENYVRLFTDPALRSVFVQVFLWTVAFAALSVALTFSLGMFPDREAAVVDGRAGNLDPGL